ncbi:MAG: heavy metal-binding domain-containing protein [Gemmatimonadetes bacterium]|nr:heavy metal-binding domain-containing protein [Gemmatimonadota bacterium]
MILVTTDEVAGRRIGRVLGLVRGNTIRARHLGEDIMAHLRNAGGGEIIEYTKMLAEARALGTDAVLAIRFQTADVMKGAAELMCYGTAVTLLPEDAG